MLGGHSHVKQQNTTYNDIGYDIRDNGERMDNYENF